MNMLLVLSLLALLGQVCGFFVIIETGFVGRISTLGKIVPPLLSSGISFYNPLITQIDKVETRPQSDVIKEVDCVSNEGLKLTFPWIEVGNMLDTDAVLNTTSKFGLNYDKYLVIDLVRHEVNVICSKKSAHQIAIEEFDNFDDWLRTFIQSENDRQKTGLTINFVRLAKPKMPEEIEKNYLELAKEKTLKKVIEEQTLRIQSQKESEALVAIKDNEIRSQHQTNENTIMIDRMLAKQKEADIENAMTVAKAKADREKVEQFAEGEAKLYSIPDYPKVLMNQAMATNAKYYFGYTPMYMQGDFTGTNTPMRTQGDFTGAKTPMCMQADFTGAGAAAA
jgi:regulator of protease activity HflC (stomatin/prohibitin superfamily)